MKRFFCWAGAVCLSASALLAQAPPVPSAYQDIYNLLNSQISSFDATVKASWNGSKYPVLYSSQLMSANSDLGKQLLGSNYYNYTVLLELGELQALGVRAVTFHVSFPILYAPYYTNPGDYQSYLSFYETLVSEIHSRGIQAIIESTTSVAYPGTNGASYGPYYKSLSWSQYMAARAQMVATIAQLLQPDYLTVITEPDTEANATGQTNAGTVSGSTQLLQGILAAVSAAGIHNVQMGAGCGSWNSSYTQFIQSFAAQPLQFVDTHVYPVNHSYLTTLLSAADTITAAGKKATISEMWSYKVRDSELNKISYTKLFSRDPFSFWQPMDTLFLQAMSDLANYKKYQFISPFWSHYMYAYLDYNTYGSQSPSQIIAASNVAATAANQVGTFTPTGTAYEGMALGYTDYTPPAVPSAPLLKTYGSTVVNLTWSATTDNVGVAAYRLYRNGSLIKTQTTFTYSDFAVTTKTTYTYTLVAFDARGNASAASAPLVVTTR